MQMAMGLTDDVDDMERYDAYYHENYLPLTRALVKWKPRIRWFEWLEEQQYGQEESVNNHLKGIF